MKKAFWLLGFMLSNMLLSTFTLKLEVAEYCSKIAQIQLNSIQDACMHRGAAHLFQCIILERSQGEIKAHVSAW